jgi:predicted phosphoadenosine phosphosulfate sulfurtransferase
MAVRYYLPKTVLEAARERISFIFDEFEKVVVGYSGGKDSTVIFHLTMEEAKRRGRLPLKVLFLDQEAEWQATIDQVRTIMYRDDVDPMWMQVPFKLFNATSTFEEWLMCWNPDEPERWMRPKEPIAFTENVYGTDRFGQLFNAVFQHHFKGQRAALIGGVRTEESPSRMVGLTWRPKYKWVTWAKRLTPDLHYTFYPIYDWSWQDVWVAIHRHGWPYNKVYDYQYAYGTTIPDMRVSNVHHETAVKALFWLQEFEPETYAKLTQRIGGIDTAGKLQKDFFVRELPFMFRNWREYRDFLFVKLVPEKNRPRMQKFFDFQDRQYDDYLGDKLYKAQVQSILTNDWECVKLKNFDNRGESVGVRKRLKAQKARIAAAEKAKADAVS